MLVSRLVKSVSSIELRSGTALFRIRARPLFYRAKLPSVIGNSGNVADVVGERGLLLGGLVEEVFRVVLGTTSSIMFNLFRIQQLL